MSAETETGQASALRRALLFIVLFAMAGTAAELVLLEHHDGWRQWLPLVLLGLGVLLGTGLALGPRRVLLTAWRGMMLAYVLAGVAGTWFHYQGNVEFEIERTPDLAGWALFRAAMEGATPALAPGTMLQFGLLGLLFAWRHPASRR